MEHQLDAMNRAVLQVWVLRGAGGGEGLLQVWPGEGGRGLLRGIHIHRDRPSPCPLQDLRTANEALANELVRVSALGEKVWGL